MSTLTTGVPNKRDRTKLTDGDMALPVRERRAVLARRIATVQENLRWYIRLLMTLEREQARLAAVASSASPLRFMDVLASHAGIVDAAVLERAVVQLNTRRASFLDGLREAPDASDEDDAAAS